MATDLIGPMARNWYAKLTHFVLKLFYLPLQSLIVPLESHNDKPPFAGGLIRIVSSRKYRIDAMGTDNGERNGPGACAMQSIEKRGQGSFTPYVDQCLRLGQGLQLERS